MNLTISTNADPYDPAVFEPFARPGRVVVARKHDGRWTAFGHYATIGEAERVAHELDLSWRTTAVIHDEAD